MKRFIFGFLISFLLIFPLYGENTQAPYDIPKFHNVLNQCKLTYPDGKTKLVLHGEYEGYKSDIFYADEEENMVFILNKNDGEAKKRLELRQRQDGKDSGWSTSDETIHVMDATVSISSLDPYPSLEGYTFLQILGETQPLLRIAHDRVKYDFSKKQHVYNHMWAIIKKNTKGDIEWYDLGAYSPDMHNFHIEVGNDMLRIKKDGELIVDKDISYWNEAKNYFKAGVYDSKDSDGNFTAISKFQQLTIGIKGEDDDIEPDDEGEDTEEDSHSKDEEKRIKEEQKRLEKLEKERKKQEKKLKKEQEKIEKKNQKKQEKLQKIEVKKQEQVQKALDKFIEKIIKISDKATAKKSFIIVYSRLGNLKKSTQNQEIILIIDMIRERILEEYNQL